MMRGRKGQHDTKPTRLHSMNDIPLDGYTGFPPGMAVVSREAPLASSPGMADVSIEAPLCGFRAEALHYGKHISLRRCSGLRPMPPTVGADTRGGMCRDRTLPYRHRRTTLLSRKIPEY